MFIENGNHCVPMVWLPHTAGEMSVESYHLWTMPMGWVSFILSGRTLGKRVTYEFVLPDYMLNTVF